MTFASRVRSWARSLLRRSRLEREMRDEMRFHLDAYAADLVRSGMPEAEARRQARLAFGSADARKDECREALGLRLLDELAGDVRHALRQLRRAPAFTAVVVASLALGLGANAAIFSLMEAALWRPLPVERPEELRLFSWASGPNRVMDRIDGVSSGTPGGDYAFSYPAFLELQRQRDVLETLFAFKPVTRLTALVDGQAEVLTGELVTGGYFEGLRLRPALGRTLSDADDDPGSEVAGVISDRYWARRFGRASSTIGRRISVNGAPVTIVGVTPPEFSSAQIDTRPDIFLPLRLQPVVRPERRDNETALANPDRWWLMVMGRLRAGVDDPGAQPVLDAALERAVRATLPDRADRDHPRLILQPGARGLDLLSRQFATPLLVLASLAAIVLLIACANVASLLLARTASREREVSLRLALGAGRWRVVRQWLTEGLVLAVLAGAAGLLLGYWLRDSIPALLASTWQPGPFRAAFNWRVLGLAALATTTAGVLFSLAPVWRLTRRASCAARPRAIAGPGPGAVGWRRGKPLVAAQVALSILLLLGAGLFARTLWNLGDVTLGFEPDRLLLFTIDLPASEYDGDRRLTALRELRDRIAAVSGVERATLSSRALVAFGRSITSVSPDPDAPPDEHQAAWVLGVADDYFDTMGIPLIAGRSFGRVDARASQPLAVVNQEFARRFFPGQQPIGKVFRSGRDVLEIVGVAGDARYDRLTTAMPPTFYTYVFQSSAEGPATVAVRMASDEVDVLPGIVGAVRSIDPTLPLGDVRTQRDQIAATISRERLIAALSLAFAGLAVALAGLGVYGIIANGVASRTSEIGIRLALGASRERVLGAILRDAAGVAAVGVALGVAAGLWLTRYVQAMLFGVDPIDPPTIWAAAFVMLSVAILAGWLPARRASRLEPMSALRHE
jgi:predicted permease